MVPNIIIQYRIQQIDLTNIIRSFCGRPNKSGEEKGCDPIWQAEEIPNTKVRISVSWDPYSLFLDRDLTFRADPGFWKFFKRCSRGNILGFISLFRIIYIGTLKALVLLH